MSKVEEKIMKDILKIIKDNLRILIINNDNCLKHFKEYCDDLRIKDFPIDQTHLTILVEDALYALLNADFLYDFRDIE